MKKFAFVFAMGGKVVWSGETAETLLNRSISNDDLEDVKGFIEDGKIGSFISLTAGEMIFRTA